MLGTICPRYRFWRSRRFVWSEILRGDAQCGESRLDLLREVIPLENGIPSHDTFSRVFRLLDPGEMNAALMRFTAAFGEATGAKTASGTVAVDGKSLRRGYDKGCAHSPSWSRRHVLATPS